MTLLDVNILVNAFHRDSADHATCTEWLSLLIASAEAFGVPDLALSGLIGIATHPNVFQTPGVRHWEIFESLCIAAGARGNLVTDAWFAAPAIDSGSEWATMDRDFSRFPGLRWRSPANTTTSAD